MAADSLRPLARRMGEIEPFHVMELLARARELEAAGRSIVHMEIGEPDFTTPQPVLDAAQQALAEGRTHYTPALGLPALREAIAGYYREHYGVEVSAGRIVVTPGASGALLLALGVLLDRDSEVLLADPGYPCNRHFVRFIEGRATGIPVDATTGYQLTSRLLAQHWSDATRAAMVATPSNPTGTLIPTDELAAMAKLASERGGALLVDEIYHGLIYEQQPPSALALSDELFVINSFSKYFCMTGWRLGWLVVPEAYRREVEKLAQNLFIAAPTLAQHAALAAFSPESLAILEQRKEAFRQRRDYLLPALRELGFEIPVTPQGAFYLYADCSRFSNDSFSFAAELLEQAGVAITPGIDFGSHLPERHLRFAYTTSMEQLQEGVSRLATYLKQRG
ncbi:MAG: pyridoxal phosphate-dependent aminotransferase [Gammaproteobacteria bacterium]|nr:pyridoxal phosphate-dependent aminotransferase [Gammaproteobacteria bacterium]MCW8972718.1 pyridoxal phosphate-dependent aminotransferase [Gammaproteobacteria bacterium]MCW8993819.1 pyridoxal phosphate-dependent aminotransferase [Gammaproteobacteria bacterium]